jgi:hypothetical protein
MMKLGSMLSLTLNTATKGEGFFSAKSNMRCTLGKVVEKLTRTAAPLSAISGTSSEMSLLAMGGWPPRARTASAMFLASKAALVKARARPGQNPAVASKPATAKLCCKAFLRVFIKLMVIN